MGEVSRLITRRKNSEDVAQIQHLISRMARSIDNNMCEPIAGEFSVCRETTSFYPMTNKVGVVCEAPRRPRKPGANMTPNRCVQRSLQDGL